MDATTISSSKPAGPCAMVIFGASGDLTKRKLLPALVNLARDRILLSRDFAVIGSARRPFSDDDFRRKILADLRELMPRPPEPEIWEWLAPRLFYLPGEIHEPETYKALTERLKQCDSTLKTGGNYLFYLSTAPDLVAEIAGHLGASELAGEKPGGGWRRLIVEKPFGHDAASAAELNRQLRGTFAEQQIYRIDHYLGKETVQNLIVFRFANGIFEPLWNHKYVDHVQITVAETVGVEGRGGYYDGAGTLRDMLPNHLFQLVSLVGMEPPASLEADAIRDEQVKLIKAIRPFTAADVARNVVRGQYVAGTSGGKPVPGYVEEPNVPRDSQTDTFVALKLVLDNWRWARIPFYVRTGKRLAQRNSEIVVQFRRAPHLLFQHTAISACSPNQLVINVQPHEGVSLRFGAKVPGPVVKLGAVTMDFDYARSFGNRPSTGYERLLFECMLGDATLFQRADMVELCWNVVEPVQTAFREQKIPLAHYPSGSWGPKEATALLAQDGRNWREAEAACGD